MAVCSDKVKAKISWPETISRNPSGLCPVKSDFSQVWFKTIHLVDNLLLPLVLLSQLYQLIPQGHIFPEKDQTTLWDLHWGWFKETTKNWRTKQFWAIYNKSLKMASFGYSTMLGGHPVWVWMGRQLASIVFRLPALCTSIRFLCSCLSSLVGKGYMCTSESVNFI